jgi:hypothetical protein
VPGAPKRAAEGVRKQNETGDGADGDPKVKIALAEDIEGN